MVEMRVVMTAVMTRESMVRWEAAEKREPIHPESAQGSCC